MLAAARVGYAKGRIASGGSGSTIASDAFNRANNTTSMGSADTGQSWTSLFGTWGIDTNQARCYSANSQQYVTIDALVADCTVAVTLGGTLTSGGGLSFRATDANNCWFIDANNGLWKVQGGSLTQIATVFGSYAAGDVLGVILSGTSIQATKNGTVVYSTTQSFNSTATKHGLRDYGGLARFDNFSITT